MSLELCPKCGNLSVEFDPRLGRQMCLMIRPYCGWRNVVPPTLEERVALLEAKVDKLEEAA